MRKLTDEEIMHVIAACNWASICTVGEDGMPYAVEATPFFCGEETGFMINPRGGTWRNLQHSSKVLLKYTLAAPDLRGWAGVSCFGTGRFVSEPEEIRNGWQALAQVMNTDYTKAAEKFASLAERSDRTPFFAVRVHARTGRCSASKDEPLNMTRLLAGQTLAEQEDR